MAWGKANLAEWVFVMFLVFSFQREELPRWDLAWVEDKPQDPEDLMGRKIPFVLIVKDVFQLSRSLVTKRRSQLTVTPSVRNSARQETRVWNF